MAGGAKKPLGAEAPGATPTTDPQMCPSAMSWPARPICHVHNGSSADVVTQSNQMASPISRFCADLWLSSGCEDDILPSWNLASIQAKDIARHHGLRHPRRGAAAFHTPDPDSGQGESSAASGSTLGRISLARTQRQLGERQSSYQAHWPINLPYVWKSCRVTAVRYFTHDHDGWGSWIIRCTITPLSLGRRRTRIFVPRKTISWSSARKDSIRSGQPR